MPTPIDILLDPVSLAALAIFAALVLAETLAPGRRLAAVRGWHVRAAGSFAVYFFLSSYLPLLWDGWLAGYRLVDLTHWGVLRGATAGLLAYEAGAYAWHRAMHASTWLWHGVHQMHHSAERLDAWGAFYFGPADMVGWTLLGSLVLALGIGLDPRAATVVLLATFFFGVFQHTNIRTPRWLGYLVQRPESHTVHHARGVHAGNYADLPIFDLLFGTFRNPEGFDREVGFYDGASARVWEMLIGRDVSTPPTDAGIPAESPRIAA